MGKRKPLFIIALLSCILNGGFLFAQVTVPRIENLVTDTVHYCSDSELVVPSLVIQNVQFDDDGEGIKISVANYKKGEDLLVYKEDTRFTYHWNDANGYLEIKGKGTASQYQEAARNVFYKNIASVPDLDPRSFSISLLDADYLPSTQHFYRYVPITDITWKEARDSAAKMEYYGLQGYLATITSSVENDFIWTKIDGVGWIGATDEDQEGKWIWATGPENGTHFWQGTANGGYRVNGQYSFWASDEPNNAHTDVNGGVGEDYAHINQHPSKAQRSWNDLRNAGDGPNSNYYRPQGFVVEFGGMEGDPEVKLSASAIIKVSKIAFSDQRFFEICQGEKQELNLAGVDRYQYSWTPVTGLSSSTLSNPEASPMNTTTYYAMGKLGECRDTAEFIVQVNPLPVHGWKADTTICKGASVVLDPGEHSSYLWENLDTSRRITVSEMDWYTVKLTNEYGCTSKDSIQVKWSVKPGLDYGALQSLVCGKKQQQLSLVFQSGTASTTLYPIGSDALVQDNQSLSPTIVVNKYGEYQFRMGMTDQFGCGFADTLSIGFHNQPSAKFQIDEAECEGYNLRLFFEGHTEEEAIFNWYSNDTVYQSGVNLDSMVIPLGYGTRNRTVGLLVDEMGCMDSLTLPVTVTPILDFWPETREGCTPLTVAFDYTATEEIDSFFWQFGDEASSLEVKPVHVYENAHLEDAVFNVNLRIVSEEGCENQGTFFDAVVVHPIPSLELNFGEDGCYPDSMEIMYTGSAVEKDTFLWDLSDFLPGEVLLDPGTSPGPFVIKRSSAPTVDIGLQVISQFGCQSDTLVKTLKRKPVFNLDFFPSEGCPPLETEFQVEVPDGIDDVAFSWDVGEENRGEEKQTKVIFNTANQKYNIEWIGRSNVTGCSDTLFYHEGIFVYPVPEADFVPDPPWVLINDPVIQFENNSQGATYYEWNFGDEMGYSSLEEPEYRYTEMGVFNVELKALNEYDCFDTTTVQIAVAFDRIFPPNAFSPNAPLEEDRIFRIHSQGIVDEGYQLEIFNRWGEIFFESESQHVGWDGKMRNGQFAPAGTYTWVLRYTDFRGEAHKQQGTVTLLF